MPRVRLSSIVVLAALLAAPSAFAQSSIWGFGEPAKRGNVPGDFDYYTLVMSWSPTHCASDDRRNGDTQCDRDDGVRFGFIMHGLWPQYEKGYPERCFTRWKPFVPDDVIANVFDVMPSRGLVIHQYRDHGTCSGMRPAPYFALAERTFKSITVPRRYRNPQETQFVSPRDVVDDFIAANPQLKPDMMSVICGGPGNRLREVRICVTKVGQPRACGQNERRGNACRASTMFLPPVRSKHWDFEKDELTRKYVPEMPQNRANNSDR